MMILRIPMGSTKIFYTCADSIQSTYYYGNYVGGFCTFSNIY